MKFAFAFAVAIWLRSLGWAAEPPTRAALQAGSFVVKEDLRGVHPRMFFTPAEVAAAIERYRRDPDSFAQFLPEKGEVAAAPAGFTKGETGTTNGNIVLRLAAAAVLTGNPLYGEALKKWAVVLEPFEAVRFAHGGGDNHDLVSGHLLFCLATAYDLLKGGGDPAVTEAVRNALITQARATYADLNGMRTFAYEQNHFTIPVSGLAMAACVLADELPEAEKWGVFGTNTMRRTLSVLAPDGWYFEGLHYWAFTMQNVLVGAAAVQTVTGEDFFSRPPLSNMSTYLAHMILPNPRFGFDFADFGPRVERDGVSAQKGYEIPWHTLEMPLELFIPRLMDRLRPDALLEEVMARRSVKKDISPTGAVFSMFWPMPAGQSGATSTAMPYHYFPDMEVVHWRTNWSDPDATAIAFRAGPPAGHNEGRMLAQFPEWKPSFGHAHPDSGAFTIFSHGVFLANGDLAYVGKKETANTDSLLVDGIGQGKEGTPWDTFRDRPYAVYDQIHLADVWLGPRVMAATAVFGAAYRESLKMTKVERELVMVDGRFLVVRDFLESDTPHQYQWLYHGDQKPTNPRPNVYVMDNGPGRIVMEHLGLTEQPEIGPDVVETELYSPLRSRPQQRGFHLQVSSPPQQKQFQFLVAMGIQSSKDAVENVTFSRSENGPVHLTDGEGSCDIWTRGDAGLDGAYAYVLRGKDGKIIASGVYGRTLKVSGLFLQGDKS